jgi:para-nitrobenzyl esterase
MRSYVIEHHDGIGEPLSPEAFPDVVAGLYGDEAPAVLDEYRLDQFESPGIALATILTDEGRFQGACQRLPYLDAASRRQPTFAYEFAELTGETPGGFPQGAAHGADVPYFFDSYQQPGEPLPPERQQLADELIARWTHFARTGEPGGGWPGYRDGVARSFAVDAIEPVDLAITHRCGFWGASPQTGGPT